MRIAVIGGIAGGTSAAAKAKRTLKSAEITIFEAGNYVSVGACGMPYCISGDIEDPFHLVVRKKEDFERSGINVKLGYRVTEIDLKKGLLRAESKEGKEESYPFDRLVIATGARARTLNVPGANLKGIFTLKQLDDLLGILSYMKENDVKKVAVIGSGFIGLEVIDGLLKRGIKPYSIDIASYAPPQFDEDIVEDIPKLMDENGVVRYWGVGVEEFVGDEKVREVKLSSGDRIPVDMVIVSIGVIPNSELAKEAGLELSVANTIKVNEYMETSHEGVFAAGDCTHCYSVVTGEPIYLPLGSIANRHGRVAGSNVAGKRVVMPKVAGTSIFKFFDLGIARVGLVEKELKERGVNYGKVLIKAGSVAHYYPGGGTIKVKLLWDKDSGRLMGGEIVGPYTGVKRIDVIAAVISMNGTVEDLKRIDLAYSPPFSPVWDPLSVAANQAVKD